MLLRSFTLGLCLACAGTALGESPPMEVTTDTQSYCASLAAQIGRAPTPSPDATRLAAEGSELCREGYVQGGLHRLRRALAVMRQQGTP